MRALSLTQPWATLVAMGIKPVENRKWRPSDKLLGEDFAIHASAKFDYKDAAWIQEHFADDKVVIDLLNGKHVQSAILGVVKLAGYMRGGTYFHRVGMEIRGEETHELMHSKWFFGKFGYVLEDVRTLPSPVIGVKGSLNFWNVPQEIEKEVLQGLEELEKTVRRATT